jgi:hypothetical protein
MIMKILGVIFIILVWSLVTHNKETPMEYEPSWSSSDMDKDYKIARALTRNSVRGCGEYRFKREVKLGRYWVQCSMDERNWENYIVWPSIEKVDGPVDMTQILAQ